MFEASEYAQERYSELVERGVKLARFSRAPAGDAGEESLPRLGWLRGFLTRRVRGRATPLVGSGGDHIPGMAGAATTLHR
jgi:hypothetical protein